jgi:acetone carboxylase gamma subunit
MIYPDAVEVLVGDVVSIGSNGKGKVVACMYRDNYSFTHPREQWSYLETGVLVDTEFGGVVHYPDQASLAADGIRLHSRGS